MENVGTGESVRWLATDLDPARRDGAEAVRQARNVCQTGEGKLSSSAWNTLAAALAKTGPFPAAVAAAHEAIRLTRSAGNEVPAVLDERLAAYEHHQPLARAAGKVTGLVSNWPGARIMADGRCKETGTD